MTFQQLSVRKAVNRIVYKQFILNPLTQTIWKDKDYYTQLLLVP